VVAVSVVIPTYNSLKVIEPCIDSLLGQTLSPVEIDIIFVDDGSVDGTPERLRELAEANPNVRVFEEPRSGWPGRPRNVGIDHATGDYVFFCDHDDWLSPDALRRMTGFADRTAADVLVAKMVGHGRGVPRILFQSTLDAASLVTRPLLMSSLTPHKLFRRRFLNEHGLRFPEGVRRLEDHVFVVRAYFLASNIAVLSDYSCYHHIKRADGMNAAFEAFDPVSYYGYVRETLDIIEAHTDPGPQRAALLERPFNQEMLGRLRARGRLLAASEASREVLLAEIRRLMIERFPDDFEALFPFATRVFAAAVRAGRLDTVMDLNDRLAALRCRATLTDLRWETGRWRAHIEVEILVDGSPVLTRSSEEGEWVLDPRLTPIGLPARPEAADDPTTARPVVVVIDRVTGEEWFVPCEFEPSLRPLAEASPGQHVVMVGSADLDVATLAGGRRLAKGRWDVNVRMSTLGVELQSRLGPLSVDGFPRPSPALVGPRSTMVVPYLTEQFGNLTLDVGQQGHTLVEELALHSGRSFEASGEHLSAAVDVDVGPGSPPRSVDLELCEGDLVVAAITGQIMLWRGLAVLRIDRAGLRPVVDRRVRHGRYTVAARPRPKTAPLALGTLTVDRRGRVVSGDLGLGRGAE
jgi:glycosyltransferase involved in cell wall biosynthesis